MRIATTDHDRPKIALTGRASFAPELLARVARGAKDIRQVSGLTHDFYRYPARFSPAFAAEAIEAFSRAGDLVLDPYMGGGTVVVEAAARGRDVVGNDINALSHFLATVKTTALSEADCIALRRWANNVVPELRTREACDVADALLESERAHNMTIPRARYLKRIIATALASIAAMPGESAQNFARCAVLNTAQWALDGKKSATSVGEFRDRLASKIPTMLDGVAAYTAAVAHVRVPAITLTTADAVTLTALPIFTGGRRARLVVTSPPYPGVHVLYHRWQVDGRRESPAPYWIANKPDGQGASYYSFASRTNLDGYFASSLRTLLATRAVMESGAVMAQLIAFTDPKRQLARYLENMEAAGFAEIRENRSRTWRGVPNRKWHAAAQGSTASAREVLLLHEAI